MELSSKNLYDYLSKHNSNQRKFERLLDFFKCSDAELNELLLSGQAMGIFIYDDEDGWKTQDFAKIDSKRFFDFVYAGVKISPSKPLSTSKPQARASEKKSQPKAGEGKPENSLTSKASQEILAAKAKVREDSQNSTSAEAKADTSAAEAVKTAPKVEENPDPTTIEQKAFSLRALFKLILKRNEFGTSEKLMMLYYDINDVDLRFVMDYTASKGIFRRDTQGRWFANAECAKDPMLAKTLIGLRNSAILNNEFKKKAMRGGRN